MYYAILPTESGEPTISNVPSSDEIRTAHPGDFYFAFHAPRYERLLRLIGSYSVTDNSTVLDVGSSRLTELIHTSFSCQIDTAVRNLAAAAFEKATRVLKTHHQALDETAALLLAKETLSADELPAHEPYVDAPELLSPTGSSRSDSPARG